ncbi:MAG: folK [Clostridia bacterium]|jgi:2-amino-4-hydroxy-6-hydroxymethyldihydropteridine diphosphokinase|nr:folK [Clostridia bacterium]
MPRAYLGIGGNIGNVKENIEEALKMLQEGNVLKLRRISSYYETAPVGYEQQEWFLNIVAEVETQLTPYELLSHCNKVEHQLKRERLIRWGPRTIDIDILLYEDYVSDEEKLTIPHPRMHERAFVMIPLQEIAPDLYMNGRSIMEISSNLNNQEIRKLKNG